MSQFKVEPHSFNKKMMNWQYCSKCGLVALKNEFTEWSMKQGCNHKEHSQYESKRIHYSNFKS